VRLFIELLLIATIIVVSYTYGPILWRRWRERQLRPRPRERPRLAPRAIHLAAEDERMREAVDLRNKIAELADKPEVGLDDAVVHEVDELIAGMVALHDTKAALAHHLLAISEERLRRDEALLEPESVANQRRQLEALRQRGRTLEAELARAVAGLREAWLGLLDALAQRGGGLVSGDRGRAQIETLRIRVQAEREARSEVEVTL
jgi:hypothetical protein